jgi:endonuclease/exonuclease/phosphatase family metal-dependent hydrolase
MRLLQLNIALGEFLPAIITYIQENDFDIIHLQEVCRGKLWGNTNTLAVLRQKLDYVVSFQRCWRLRDEGESYFGNATLYKSSLRVLKKETITMKEGDTLEKIEPRKFEHLPRYALSFLFESQGKQFYTINTHMAWGPTPLDEPYKLEQAKKLAAHINRLTKPFVLTGDFNVTPKTESIQLFDALGRNLINEYHITNTLNPRTHRVKHLFPQGLAVDYIFTGNGVHTHDFSVVDTVDLSDHYGLSVDFTCG